MAGAGPVCGWGHFSRLGGGSLANKEVGRAGEVVGRGGGGQGTQMDGQQIQLKINILGILHLDG